MNERLTRAGSGSGPDGSDAELPESLRAWIAEFQALPLDANPDRVLERILARCEEAERSSLEILREMPFAHDAPGLRTRLLRAVAATPQESPERESPRVGALALAAAACVLIAGLLGASVRTSELLASFLPSLAQSPRLAPVLLPCLFSAATGAIALISLPLLRSVRAGVAVPARSLAGGLR